MSRPPRAPAVVQPIEEAAREVAPWIAELARVGYVADAVLYATIGILAALLALHRGGEITDAAGAFRAVLRAPLGDVLLLVCALGFAGYALWRAVDAITDAEGHGRDLKGIAARVGGVLVGLVYGGLALLAFRSATGAGGEGGSSAERFAARLLALPAGAWLTWLAALALLGFGGYQVYCAWQTRLDRQLNLAALTGGPARCVIPLCRAGIAARGIVFGLIGLLLVRAATHRDPAQAGGIREALHLLARTGGWAVALVSLGLVAYAVYELLNARYRRIP